MSVGIETTLTVTDEAGIRTQALLDLIQLKIGHLRAGYLGHRPIGADDLTFPCVMVECVESSAKMYTTGKFDVRWTVNIYYYVVSENRDQLVRQQTEVMEALTKLLSNNALSDGTPKYKSYPGYWLDSEMLAMKFSGTFAWSRPEGPKFARAGLMTVELMDRILK